MLSKRNFAMMLIMIFVILGLFLFSVVTKEYFNDYDVNHAADTEVIEKIEQDTVQEGEGNPDEIPPEQKVLYIGSEDNGYYPAMKEWAEYRRKYLQSVASLEEAEDFMKVDGMQKPLLLLDGELLETNTEILAEKLIQYVKEGGVVIFYRLPSYRTIEGCETLRNLLGIQNLRGESVELYEIRLYSGFLLGGETCYSFEGVKESDIIDLDREIPWYDISSRTKSYMVGFLSEEEKTSMELKNEDMPAIIWRAGMDKGFVFAVNGDYMKGEGVLGFLDAMVYETEDYALYQVVNAQNLSVAGFPDLTVENEEQMVSSYGMNTEQFCRDILWPSLVAGAEKDNWKLTNFLSVKQSAFSMNEPNQDAMIDYLKYFNEESAEAGASLGRIDSADLRLSLSDEKNTLEQWGISYTFTGGYVRKENKDKLSALFDKNGELEFFRDIRTVVGEYEREQSILSWMTDRITLQNTTANAYRHSYKDSLRLKSFETALGYSNILVDMYQVLWPKSEDEEWHKVAEKMAENIDTYWKPFSVFEKTTITESDARVRNFLNGKVESDRKGDRISIRTKDFTDDRWLLLRTHGEKPDKMNGGIWTEVEKNTYLLQLISETASVTLKPDIELNYTE